MPAKKKTREDRLNESFSRLYRMGKSRAQMTEDDIADALGITRTTLRNRRRNPKTFPFGDVLKLCALFLWDDGEMTQLVRLYCVKGDD